MDFLACLSQGGIPIGGTKVAPSANKSVDLGGEEVDLDYFADQDSKSTRSKSKQKIQKKATTKTVKELLPLSSLFASQEQISLFRKQQKIRIYGDVARIPPPCRSWQDLDSCWSIPAFLMQNIRSNPLISASPTAIQMQAIGTMLQEVDLIACAPTGSGKTLAYCIPIISKLQRSAKKGFRALVVAPTKELARQIYGQFHRMTLLAPGREEHALKSCLLTKELVEGFSSTASNNYDILICTPMLLIQAIEQKSIDLSGVSFVVFDEADRLLDMGFLEQADKILAACTSTCIQKALFSATISSSVETLAGTFMQAPVKIVVGTKGGVCRSVSQKLMFIGNNGDCGKRLMLKQLLAQGALPLPAIVFVREIERVHGVVGILHELGFKVSFTSSQQSSGEREEAVDNFRLGKTLFLVATDVLARGMDFKNVKSVLNYDCPETVATYVHRVGRTGRGGSSGLAVTFFSKQDSDSLRGIGNAVKESGGEVPAWIMSLPKLDNSQIRKKKQKLARLSLLPQAASKKKKKHSKKEEQEDCGDEDFHSDSDTSFDNEDYQVPSGDEEIDSDCA